MNLGLFQKEPESQTKAPTSPALILTALALPRALPPHKVDTISSVVPVCPRDLAAGFCRLSFQDCSTRESLSVPAEAGSNPPTVSGLSSSCLPGRRCWTQGQDVAGDCSQPLLLTGVFSSHFSSRLIQNLLQILCFLLSPPPFFLFPSTLPSPCSLSPPGGTEYWVPSEPGTATSVSCLVLLSLWVAAASL